MFDVDGLRQALTMLGTLLDDRSHSYEVVAVGGGGLLLLGIISRPTKDLDALALVEAGSYELARPMPQPLVEAVRDTASELGLADDWFNPGPTQQLTQGLPPGFVGRTTVMVFGGLTLHLAGRFDQICFKLYAAVDGSHRSKHLADLVDLDPTHDELDEAARWVKQQDIGELFADHVDECRAHFESLRARP